MYASVVFDNALYSSLLGDISVTISPVAVVVEKAFLHVRMLYTIVHYDMI